jgi:hypothetical protein
MNEQKVREILKDAISIEDNRLIPGNCYSQSWYPGDKTINIDGEYTADELKAMAWWMENKNK